MYEKLKQIMREAGYAVSEGADWLASDMQHFVTFSRHVLGATTPHLNHLLAYPEAYPHVMARAGQLAEGFVPTVPAAEPVAEAVETTPVEDAPPAEPAAQPDASILDVSASGQTEKQELNADQGTEQAQEPTEQPPTGEQATSEGEKAADEQGTEQPEDAEKPADDQSNEGEQPQE